MSDMNTETQNQEAQPNEEAQELNRVLMALENERKAHAATRAKLKNISVEKKPDETPPSEIINSQHDISKIQSIFANEKAKWQKEIEEANNKIADMEKKNNRRDIADQVLNAARKHGVVNTALDDVALLSSQFFEKSEAGVHTKFNVSGLPGGVTPEEWILEQKKIRPHLFGSSKGSGSRGSTGSNQPVENPWDPKTRNMTKQVQLFKSDPELARRLAKMHGEEI